MIINTIIIIIIIISIILPRHQRQSSSPSSITSRRHHSMSGEGVDGIGRRPINRVARPEDKRHVNIQGVSRGWSRSGSVPRGRGMNYRARCWTFTLSSKVNMQPSNRSWRSTSPTAQTLPMGRRTSVTFKALIRCLNLQGASLHSGVSK